MNTTEKIAHKLPDYWEKIYLCAQNKGMSDKEKKLAAYLYSEYELRGYISEYTFIDMLKLSDAVMVQFFINMYQKSGYAKERPKSIVEHMNNTDWLMEQDYCFFNIRALGREVYETGNIISAIKILPLLRISAIHLAPFFECSEGIIYCQKSFYRINHEIISWDYYKFGVSPTEQMKFLIDCCHLLKISVGFDMTPHTSYDSGLRLDRPDIYRWIRLTEEKNSLYCNMNIDEQYTHRFQLHCQKEIKRVVDKIKREYGIGLIDSKEISYEQADEITDKINKKIQDKGFFAVPPHTWNGIAVPGFKEFSHNLNAPMWEYCDRYGRDQGQHAIWLHANFYIHTEMKANKIVNIEETSHRNEPFFDFMKHYLEQQLKEYKFDFLRIDYVDHIFDNVTHIDKKEFPLNEMLTPNEILDIITYLREKWQGLGLLADHVGKDIDRYEKAGFNLIIDSNVALKYNAQNLKKILADNMVESTDSFKCRTAWAIDTHDMAHPLFLGKELAIREGKIGCIARFFLSRFANVGMYRKPRYEVIGNQDMSFGIHRANNRPESISWKRDREVLDIYNKIENQYEKLKMELVDSVLESYCVTDNTAYFVIRKRNRSISWIGIVPLPFGNESFLENTSVELDCCMETKIKQFPLIKSRICYIVSEEGYFNYTDPDSFCTINYDINTNKYQIEQKKKGLALLEVHKEVIKGGDT